MLLEILEDKKYTVVGWLDYYPQVRMVQIELPDNENLFAQKFFPEVLESGERTVGFNYCARWAKQMGPAEWGKIRHLYLKEDSLIKDELLWGTYVTVHIGCEKYHLRRIQEEDEESLTDDSLIHIILRSIDMGVKEVIPLPENQLRVFFGNRSTKIFDFSSYAQQYPKFEPVLNSPEWFNSVMLTSDSYGITWGENLHISYLELYRSGREKSMNLDEIERLFQYRVINSAEAAELLNCSRQNIEDLVRRDRLFPVKTMPKGKLFLKGAVESRRKG